eukprot:RCo050015
MHSQDCLWYVSRLMPEGYWHSFVSQVLTQTQAHQGSQVSHTTVVCHQKHQAHKQTKQTKAQLKAHGNRAKGSTRPARHLQHSFDGAHAREITLQRAEVEDHHQQEDNVLLH